MKVIGLTGGIGTGKSTAAEYLLAHGMVHVDADQIAREITYKGSPLISTLNGAFGHEGEFGRPDNCIITADGELDRKALAGVAFASEEAHKRLNDIMYGAIISEIKMQIECHRSSTLDVLLDVPQLFESGTDSLCNKIIVLYADMDVRISRVCARDGVKPEDVEARISNQMSPEEMKKRADFVVDNSGTVEELHAQLDRIIPEL